MRPIREDGSIDERSREKLQRAGLLVETLDASAGVQNADYVYTDTWLDMEFSNDPAFEEEKRRRCEIMMPYQINAKLLEGTRAKIMHDMPIHAGYEITEDMVECDRSIIYDQAENRLDAQKAIMLFLLHELK